MRGVAQLTALSNADLVGHRGCHLGPQDFAVSFLNADVQARKYWALCLCFPSRLLSNFGCPISSVIIL